MKKLILSSIFFLAIIFLSCETYPSTSSTFNSTSSRSSSSRPFSDFYDSWVDARSRQDVIALKAGENPKLIRSNNLDDDIYEIVSDNYLIVGKTSFNGPSEDIIDDINSQCKKNGATIALYSLEYAYTTGYYSIRRYDYSVYYFVKKTGSPDSFGFWVIDLSADDRRNLEMNTGAKVNVIYKYTPAFYANFLRGDIIISINGNNVTNALDFDLYCMLNDFTEDEEIEIVFIRRGQERKAKIRVE